MKYNCSASLVLYHNQKEEIDHVVKCYFNALPNGRLYVIDNSKNDFFSFLTTNKNIIYIKNSKNIGYGAAHNIALRKVLFDNLYQFHIILNPDVSFSADSIKRLLDFSASINNIGLVSPRIINSNGNQEYLCKLIPSPIDLIIRLFKLRFFKNRISKFQLLHFDHNKVIEAPYLSGCFMLVRVEILRDIGFFDENFFMYPEDIDFTRRINEKYKTLYFPDSTIIHKHNKESFKNIKMFYIHCINIIKYFNKWGWLYDHKRYHQNKIILNQNQDYYKSSIKNQL